MSRSSFSFQWLFFSLAIAGLLGLGARIFLSPERVRGWIAEALERQPSPIELKFEDARVELSRGAIPQFAVVLTNVSVAMDGGCELEPAIAIRNLRVPVRVFRILTGDFAIGRVRAEDLVIDLDLLKHRCSETESGHVAAHGTSSQLSMELNAPRATSDQVLDGLSGDGQSRSWWTHEQFEDLRDLIGGFDFERVELRFEGRTKSVFLESFSATPTYDSERNSENGRVDVLTRVRVPPSLVYGEVLPVMRVRAEVRADTAEVELKGTLNEGTLQAKARFAPAPEGLQSDIHLKVESVPLSKLVPFLAKADLANLDLKPRFIWLDCGLSIGGRFRKLFHDNPLKVESCRLHGKGMNVSLREATRAQDGTWGPMVIDIENAEVSRVLDAIGAEGPSGIASDYGRLGGRLEIKSRDHLKLSGKVENAVLRFSNRNARAQQSIEEFELRLERSGKSIAGELTNVRLKDGEFRGSVKFGVDVPSTQGSVHARIEAMVLSPGVQDVLVGGRIETIKGDLKAGLLFGEVSSLAGELQFGAIQGRSFRIPQASIKTDLKRRARSEGSKSVKLDPEKIALSFKAPFVEVLKGSTFATASQQVFFGDVTEGDSLRIDDFVLVGALSANGGFEWEKANATFDRGRVHLTSSGEFSRDRALSGWLSVDYPAVKKLKWSLGGEIDAPVLKVDSPALRELKKRPHINAAILGLSSDSPVVKRSDAGGGNSSSALMDVTTKTSKGIKALGSKVIQKARGILPDSTNPESRDQ